MNILLIKQSSILSDVLIKVLNRQFPDSKIEHCYECNEEQLMKYGERSDLIIVDLQIPVSIKKLLCYYQLLDKKVVAWIEKIQDPNLASMFELALSGYLYYKISDQKLIEAITQISEGERYIHPKIANLLLEEYIQSNKQEVDPPLDIMSQREWEVLQLLTKGYSNIKIANALFLSDKTVKNYVSSILAKLNVPDRTNAVLLALEKRWISV